MTNDIGSVAVEHAPRNENGPVSRVADAHDTLQLGFLPGNGLCAMRKIRRQNQLREIPARILILPKAPEKNGHPEDSDDSESCAELVKLVDCIRSRETDGMAELYRMFSNSIRFYLCQQLGPQEVNDKVHDTFVIVVEAIQLGELRDASRLMGFIRTIARRQVSLHIDNVVQTRRRQMDLDATVRLADLRRNPEERAIFRQRSELLVRVLGELSNLDRKILTRYYLLEQSPADICSDMALTETQFRLLKSRAKARLGELGKKKLAQRVP
jgi:RNA polymerase sigma-70 factor (ECF subfamily)